MPTATAEELDPAVLLSSTFEAMNQCGILFFVKDVGRRFVCATDALVAHLGYRSVHQLTGLRDEDISPNHLVEHYRRYDERVLTSGTRVVELVELVRNVEGSYDWYTTTKWALRGRSGEIIGLAGVTRSLSSRGEVPDELVPLSKAVELIASEYHRKITVEELAATSAMSESHFSREFKRQFGTTPHRYVRGIRLLAACELLCTTELPLAAIAHRTGYHDQSHLSNDFSKSYGVTPIAYRRQHAAPASRAQVAPQPVNVRVDETPHTPLLPWRGREVAVGTMRSDHVRPD